MSLPAVTPLTENLLAAPLDSQPANPIENSVPRAGAVLSTDSTETPRVELRGLNLAFRGLEVPDPRLLQVQQYETDERAGFITQARQLAEREPKSVVAWTRYAQALISAGEVKLAANAAAKAISLTTARSQRDSSYATAQATLYAVTRVLIAAGNEADAEAALAAISGDGPWLVTYAALAERRGDYEEALSRLGGSQSSDVQAYRGYLLLRLGNPQHALAQLRAAWRGGVCTSSLLLNMAYAFALVGSPKKAVRSAQQAVSLAPDSRHASFNLASYLRAIGRIADALVELYRLRSIIGEGDPQLAAAIAETHIIRGEFAIGARELRRAQHHHKLPQDSPRIAELVANTALVEWRLGERSRESVLKTIRQQLSLVGANLELAVMLANVDGTTGVYDELASLYDQLLSSLSQQELAPLRIRLLLCRGDLVEATAAAISHANENPLDAEAIGGAVILRGQVLGEYADAAVMGQAALRRIPADRLLTNNVAFCLTLAGQARAAYQLLKAHTLDHPCLVATRGLAELGLGMVNEGLKSYDESLALAAKCFPGKDILAAFERILRTQEAIVLWQLHLSEHPSVPKELTAAPIPAEWAQNPQYMVLHQVATRVSMPWPLVSGP